MTLDPSARQTTIPGADETPSHGPGGIAPPSKRGRGRPKGSRTRAGKEPADQPPAKRAPRARKPRTAAPKAAAAAVDEDAELLGELEPGIRIHSRKSTVDGTPRWSHPLFPSEAKTPEEMRRYDQLDARFGKPQIIKLQRRHASTPSLVNIPHEYPCHEIDEVKIQRLYGGGRYYVRAFALYATADDELGRQATRGVWLNLDGPQKAIRIDDDQDAAASLAAAVVDPNEPEEEEEPEEEDEPAGESEAVALKRLELEAAAAAEERRAQRKKEDREEEEARERREEQRREEREAREDKRLAAARQEARDHERAMLSLRTPAPVAADPLTALATKMLLERLPAALGEGGSKVNEELVKGLMNTAAEAAPGLLAIVQQLIAAKTGVQVVEEEEEEEEETAPPPPAPSNPAPAAIPAATPQ